MPPLPLLSDPASYRPCIQDLLADGTDVLHYWLGLFEKHIETLADLPAGETRLEDDPRWPSFRQDYLWGLEQLRRDPASRGKLTVLELTIYREEKFAAHGFVDPFADLKQSENDLALRLLPSVLEDIDATPPADRTERLVRGLLAGNLFDMGSRAAVDIFAQGGSNFFSMRDNVLRRPWPVDELDTWISRLSRHDHPYRQVVFFVDNAGPDIVLGVIPLARSLAAAGARVVLAANSKPALNDITARELRVLLDTCRRLDTRLAQLLDQDRVTVVASGCASPLIDLRALTPECCAAAAEADLLILEGMGRAIESNYDARFTVDTLKIALIKDQMVADILGVNLFDPIVRFEPAD